MKTPEEIKKNARTCISQPYTEPCGSCKLYPKCRGDVNYNLIALLDLVNEYERRLAQVERERDAAVCDINNSEPCFACYYFMRNKGTCKGGKRCCDEQFRASIGLSEYDGPEWKWRGVCEENTKEEER